VAGRRHVAKPGEPACGVDGCERPAGFATETPGSGPCLRHSAASSRTRPGASEENRPGRACRAPERRLRGPGQPTRDPLALIRVLTLAARNAGFTFEEAWTVATVTALHYMSDRRAEEWWDVLTATEPNAAGRQRTKGRARRSPSSHARFLPQPMGYSDPLRPGEKTANSSQRTAEY
jgi:hypothetical protein